jgi:2,4-dienoyl-CoA reductase-like NADH-dependent reductase (Old Yellow Enzyme family)
LTEQVREASGGRTRLFIQLIDFLTIRRRPKRDVFLARHLAITEAHRDALAMPGAGDAQVRERLLDLDEEALADVLAPRELEALRMGLRERVTDMHLDHIRKLPQTLPPLFAAGAERAKQAGFDGVELHYAHAYTMASLLSAQNTRADGYGGSKENRIRLPLEVYRAVRDAVGADFPVGCRFLAEECIEGGSGLADAVYFGRELAGAGMDFLSLSRGGKFEDAKQPSVGQAAYPYTGPSGYECMPSYISDERGPFGRNLEPAAAIRAAVRAAGLDTPVVVSGGMHGFEQAEAVLAEGKADVIGFARQALADPDWFVKVRSGHGSQVRLCEYTNYCEGLDQKHKQVTCQLWDRLELDAPGVTRSNDGRRRLTAPAWRKGCCD